jgi:hypothetical protein
VTSRAMVTGSRDWTSRNTVFAALANAEFSLRSPIEVLHGGLDRGADAFASQWCRETGTSQRNYWPSGVVNRDSLLARNIAMVNDAPDLVLAFFAPTSRGTWHAVTAALEAGIPVRWFVQDGLTRADIKKCRSAAAALVSNGGWRSPGRRALALWLNGLIVGYSRPPGLDDVLAEALGG